MLVSVLGLSLSGGAQAQGQEKKPANEKKPAKLTTIVENRTSLGDGYLESYVKTDNKGAVKELGVLISEEVLESLPTEKNDGTTCWDKNEDGVLDRDNECGAGHVRVLYLPKLLGLPFKYVLFNWQPLGHGPVDIYDKGHFDMHVFIQDNLDRLAIRPGPCNAIINCDDFERAQKPVPEEFFPVGMSYQPGGAAQAYMGNHLGDFDHPEWHGEPLTHAITYGIYDGHITFLEPLVAVEWLKTKPNECEPIKQAPEVEITGYYPLTFCTRYVANAHKYAMTLEDFVYRHSPSDREK